MTTKQDILEAAVEILEREGPEAVTTRAVCLAAGITAPTLYHHFGDKNGLLRAVVAGGVERFMTLKRASRKTDDALADLKRGWDEWIAFATERPKLFRLMVENTMSDPGARREAYEIMRATVERLHEEGRLSVDVETAAHSIWAASNGVLSLFMQGATAPAIHATSELLFDALAARLSRSRA